MEIDVEKFLPDVGRFDLAISLEVLEHITPEAGARAITWLCQRSDIVLFSAAIPGQRGVHHINEDWQSSGAKQFASHGYLPYDIIRPKVWGLDEVPWWYRQNTIVYAKPESAARFGWTPTEINALDIVHPDLYRPRIEALARLRQRSIKGRLRSLRALFSSESRARPAV
jgi:hypothetical protein